MATSDLIEKPAPNKETGNNDIESGEGSPDTQTAGAVGGPGYYKSRTAEEWRAYHREYYRKHAERRRQQKKASHQRARLTRIYVRCGGVVPMRVIRMLFLREGSAPSRPKKSNT